MVKYSRTKMVIPSNYDLWQINESRWIIVKEFQIIADQTRFSVSGHLEGCGRTEMEVVHVGGERG